MVDQHRDMRRAWKRLLARAFKTPLYYPLLCYPVQITHGRGPSRLGHACAPAVCARACVRASSALPRLIKMTAEPWRTYRANLHPAQPGLRRWALVWDQGLWPDMWLWE